MTQEEKELLLKDLCARLPYGVKVETPYNKTCHNSAKVIGVVKRAGIFKNIEYIDILTDKCTYPIKYIKPYLRPLSSMTEEERKEYNEYLFYGASIGLMSNTESAYELIDWLNKKMFDFRNLIECGLAIAVTEENNPYK